ncbi:WD40 repeat-like protein [Mycena olivaceomarginata]|nr:WD40 repeat-like protein [Mycena olivaceomarginata]
MVTGGGSVELERGAHGRHSRIVAVSHDDKCVLIASESSSAALCDATTGEIITTFEGHTERICRAAFASPIGRPHLATSSFDSTVRAATHEAICALEAMSLFSPNGVLLASAPKDHTVRIWSIAKKTCIAVLTGPTDEVNVVEFSPDGLFIAAAADDGVWIWDDQGPVKDQRTRLTRLTKLMRRLKEIDNDKTVVLKDL